MKHKDLIFIHGWGCEPDIWTPLRAQLPDFDCHTVDLGFTGKKTDVDTQKPERAIYITHSLGTMWALKHRADHMRALIAINGFDCFKKFASFRILKSMQSNLERDPEAQMHDFWSRTGLPESAHLNIDALKAGLDWLMTWDCGMQLKNLSCPVTVISGDRDPILEFKKMQDHWQSYNMNTLKDGGHNLPMTHPQECADIIKECVRAL